MTRVKICGLARAKDAELALELGADALGFVFEPTSPRCVLKTGDALQWLDSAGPYDTCVAVFGCRVRLKELPKSIRTVQAIGEHRVGKDRLRIQVARVSGSPDPESLCEAAEEANALLLDAYSPTGLGGTGERVDWGFAAAVVREAEEHWPWLKVILAGGLTPDNVAEAVRVVRPYAVDVSSGIEESPGVKDAHKVRDFIQAARQA